MKALETAAQPRKDVYAIITERITEQLTKGLIPWRQPWTDAGIPRNLISKRPYRGINVMLLSMLGFEHNYFLTFNQLKELGGYVRKGEHSHMVIFWNFLEVGMSDTDTSETGQSNKQKIPMLRYYTVFNISQCDGIPERYVPVKTERHWQPLEVCESILGNMPQKPQITHKEQRAFYNPLKDYVNMPKYTSFDRPEAYYTTLFHELIHSTGHPARVGRKGLVEMSEFGSEPYSHEELVAEIGSCYLQSFAGITNEFEQSAAYIQNWLRVLQNDSRFIISASTQAQKATDFILNVPNEAQVSEQSKPDNSVGLLIIRQVLKGMCTSSGTFFNQCIYQQATSLLLTPYRQRILR